MSRILVLADSGFGKSTSLGNIPELDIKGLNPKETFLITVTNKGLPFRGWRKDYIPVPTEGAPDKGNLLVSNDGIVIKKHIEYFTKNRPDIKNYVIDDTNYIMQDYYMDNALSKGYDVFKAIGLFMNGIFKAAQNIPYDKNFIMMMHYDKEKDESGFGKSTYKAKTVGKMVDQYITIEGKFEIVLYGHQEINPDTKAVEKSFVTNFDGEYPAKSPIGMFDDMYIKNDMGLIIDHVDDYNG
jgi:hypothetical protein